MDNEFCTEYGALADRVDVLVDVGEARKRGDGKL